MWYTETKWVSSCKKQLLVFTQHVDILQNPTVSLENPQSACSSLVYLSHYSPVEIVIVPRGENWFAVEDKNETYKQIQNNHNSKNSHEGKPNRIFLLVKKKQKTNP